MLPSPSFSAGEAAREKKISSKTGTIDTKTFNAYLLIKIGDLEIRWIDNLACHLELDKDSNTLFLFRYPSFCISNLQRDDGEEVERSVLHSCAADSQASAMVQWATSDDVTQLLGEILLSYRMLFGQEKRSRRVFRKSLPFEDIPPEGRDELLSRFCSQKHGGSLAEVHERSIYNLVRDFPILRSRVGQLQSHLSSKSPRTWKELWLDKRDSASWLTFWAVIVFGGMGLLLGILQVVFQLMQLVLQMRQSTAPAP